MPACRHPCSLSTSPTAVSSFVCKPANISNCSVEFCMPSCRLLQLQCQYFSPACRIPVSLRTSPTAVSSFVYQPADILTAVSNFPCQPAYNSNGSVEFCMPACRHPSSLPTSPTAVSNAVCQPADIHPACRHLQLQCRFCFQSADIHLACLHLQRQCRILNASLPASIQPTVNPTSVSNFVYQPADISNFSVNLFRQHVDFLSVFQSANISNCSVEFCIPACRQPSSLPTSPTTVSNAVYQSADIHLACLHLQLRCRFFPVCRHPFSLPTSPTAVSNFVCQPADNHLACRHLQLQCRMLYTNLPTSI